jgi:hypothetical protein
LVDRNDPVAEIVAQTVIGIGATGVRNPSEISKIAVKRLQLGGRPPVPILFKNLLLWRRVHRCVHALALWPNSTE